jgi:hypothetical protein
MAKTNVKTKSKAKSATKSTRSRVSRRIIPAENRNILAGAAFLFAASVVIYFGTIIYDEDLKLLMVGFGSAMLLFGGALLSAAIKTTK